MEISARISITLDGFAATPGGWPTVTVAPGTDHGAHENDEAQARCGAIVWGRSSFDQGFDGGWETWPWPDKQAYLLTSKPLPQKAIELGIVGVDDPAALAERIRADHAAGVFAGDVQVCGGGRTIRGMLQAGALDRLELLVLPVLIGTGVALFELHPVEYSEAAWGAAEDLPPAHSLAHPGESLELLSSRAFADGVVEVVYAPKPSDARSPEADGSASTPGQPGQPRPGQPGQPRPGQPGQPR